MSPTTSQGTGAAIVSMAETITAKPVYKSERMTLNAAKKLLADTFEFVACLDCKPQHLSRQQKRLMGSMMKTLRHTTRC
jgi:hypothetical protein